jgi:hypothetical protein
MLLFDVFRYLSKMLGIKVFLSWQVPILFHYIHGYTTTASDAATATAITTITITNITTTAAAAAAAAQNIRSSRLFVMLFKIGHVIIILSGRNFQHEIQNIFYGQQNKIQWFSVGLFGWYK